MRATTLAIVLSLALPACKGAAPGGDAPRAAPARGTREDIDIAALKDRLSKPGAVLIDVRTPEEFRSSHVPGAKNIPIDELASRMNEIPKDGPVQVICQVGGRSSKATDQLLDAGYPQVANVKGGTAAWIRGSNAVEGGDGSMPPPAPPATESAPTDPAQAGGAAPTPAETAPAQ